MIMITEVMGFRGYEHGWELHTGIRYVLNKKTDEEELRSTVRFYSTIGGVLRGAMDIHIRKANTLEELRSRLKDISDVLDKLEVPKDEE